MEIKDVKLLVNYIKNADEENATLALKEYGNRRVQYAIEESWKRSHRLLECAMHNREKRIKDHLIEFNDEQSVINLINFTRFFSAVEDRIKKHMNTDNEELRDALVEINDYMYQKIGKLKLDRRLNFSGGDYEEFLKD